MRSLSGGCVFIIALAAANVAAAWEKGTPQSDKYVLPPASPAVVREAQAAKARLKNVSPRSLLAHRGESDICPENTVPAFTAAVAAGFDFEFDVWMSKDGVLFVTHDVWLGARKGHAAHGWATNMVWKNSLEKSDAGIWKAPHWRGTRMPTVDDVLPLVRNGRKAIMHVCDARWDIVMPKVKAAIERHANVNPGNLWIQGGTEWVRRNLPGYKCLAPCLPRKGWLISDPPHNLEAIAEGIDPRITPVWAPRWDEELITSDLVGRLRKRGIETVVWTVNDAASAWAALGRGVEKIYTDRPTALLKEMNEFETRR